MNEIQKIQVRVAVHLGIAVTDITGNVRSKSVAYARHLAMYACRRLTRASYPELGREFGNRDHTSVIFAVQKIDRLMRDDARAREDLRAIEPTFQWEAA